MRELLTKKSQGTNEPTRERTLETVLIVYTNRLVKPHNAVPILDGEPTDPVRLR
jgi:hypothetical protein